MRIPLVLTQPTADGSITEVRNFPSLYQNSLASIQLSFTSIPIQTDDRGVWLYANQREHSQRRQKCSIRQESWSFPFEMEELMPGDFEFRNLESDVRPHIVREVELDLTEGVLYFSDRFNEIGIKLYPDLIKQAATSHADGWLGEQLQALGTLNDQEFKAGKIRKVPSNAHTLFSQCEFNRFYIRGLCDRAIELGQTTLRVYRARQSSNPRPESEAKIGMLVDPRKVLHDLRTRVGVEVDFGLPEINSGLSLEMIINAGSG
jgi:hypothetical protein